ncbi:hypothetical protein V4C53_42560 [Paraburkholderia azotifigens]|uniref:hypothetical protein n=1 Tax=Paraburkholderia azotifigens TaxID=2057004 RepID=UPI00317E3E01
MGRPRIEWDDAQLRAIMGALAALDRDFPLDNARFLDGLVAAMRAITGRVYGATTYGRLLRDVAPQAGVTRRPSTPTIQAAVLRAQALARGAIEAAAEATALVPVASRFASAMGSALRPPAGPGGAGEGSGQPVTADADALRGAARSRRWCANCCARAWRPRMRCSPSRRGPLRQATAMGDSCS